MNRSIFCTLLCSAALLGLSTSCRPSSFPTDTLQVGVILPLTGTLAEMGYYERSAMELGERQSQGALRLRFEDSRSTAVGAVNAANKLIESDKVQLIVASTTSAALAVQPLAETARIPLVAFCMDPTITAGHESTVRFYIGIDDEARQLVDFLTGLPRAERVSVLHAAVPVWRKVVQATYLPALRKSFNVPPLVEEYDLQSRDFRSALGKIGANGTTTLILLGYGFEYPPLFQQMEELGLRKRLQRIVGGWGFLYTSLTPADLESVIVAGPQYVFERNPAADEFVRQFQGSTGRKANFDAAFAYELVSTLPVLRSGGYLSASMINQGVRALGRRRGIVGEYYFSERGDMIVTTGLGKYKDGILLSYRR
jgi:ABC-type branched-subunit amino acid transport system substrate-binding protein